MKICVVQFTSVALSDMIEESQKCSPNESGGILIGSFAEGCVFVQYATGAGGQATHGPGFFRRDGLFTQAELNRKFQQSGGRIDYAGEWHSHLRPVGPSQRDLRSMQWVANNPKYALLHPLLVILQRNHLGDWTPFGYQLFNNKLLSVRVECDQTACS